MKQTKRKHSKIYKQNTNETNETQTFKDMQTKYKRNTNIKRNIPFFRKFGLLFFLATSILRFTLLPYYRRIYHSKSN